VNTVNPLYGRSLAVAGDLSVDEQRYLYQKTRELKETWRNKGNLEPFRIRDPELAVYLMFLENSTRTKESFRNAACFHDVKLNVFDASSSSFTKSESLVDTVKMLFGYSRRSIFIMRTKMEGVCRALDEQVGSTPRESVWKSRSSSTAVMVGMSIRLRNTWMDSPFWNTGTGMILISMWL
jgi:aspartate carbamoyltransferase